MWLFFPHARETERRVGLPQMTGEGPAVSMGPGTLVICPALT
jgi:hypothetical protein